MGFLGFGGSRPTTAAGVKAAGSYDPGALSWQDRLAIIGATLADIGNKTGGQSIANAQQLIGSRQAAADARRHDAAMQAQIDSLPDMSPRERATAMANLKAWGEANSTRYGFHTATGGDTIINGPGGEMVTAPKLVGDNGVYGTQDATGYHDTGARAPSVAETETAANNVRQQDNADRTFDLEGKKFDWTKLFQGGQLDVSRGQLGVSRGQLGVAQAGLGLRRQEMAQGRVPAGYRQNAQGGLDFIPGGPADPNVAASNKNLRPIPSSAQTGLSNNRVAITKIDQAIAAIQKNPHALGMKNVLGDAVMQRADPAGVDVRARVADIGSQKLHDRSGAAVTASETPRLRPFIPSPTDTAATAIQKLRNFRSQYEQAVDEAAGFYVPENGYRPLHSPTASGAPDPLGIR